MVDIIIKLLTQEGTYYTYKIMRDKIKQVDVIKLSTHNNYDYFGSLEWPGAMLSIFNVWESESLKFKPT